MQELKININGFNAHLHHKNFKRHLKDLPGYSIYHVHCECSRDPIEDLKTDLCKKLLPACKNQQLRRKLEKNVEVIHNGKDNNSFSYIVYRQS